MPDPEVDFNQILHEWKNDNAMPWSRLRYDISRENIARHTDNRKLNILDFGGGDGMDSIYYAKLGHSVTLVDSSSIMLNEAKKYAEEQGVSKRLRFYQTEPNTFPEQLNKKTFNLILCHMMIEFVPDAQFLLREMCKLLDSDGLISILDTNRYSDVYMQAFQMNSLPEALKAVGRKEYLHPWVNQLIPRYAPIDLIEQLESNGCSMAGHHGVLCVCAFLPNEPKFDPQYYGELKELEIKLSDEYPYYLLARFFQLIARKQ